MNEKGRHGRSPGDHVQASPVRGFHFCKEKEYERTCPEEGEYVQFHSTSRP